MVCPSRLLRIREKSCAVHTRAVHNTWFGGPDRRGHDSDRNVVEVKRGVRVEGERKFFPGYILVKLELSDEAWQMVTSQPRVTGFLGGKGRPIPITEREAERLIRQMSEGVERPRTTVSFDIGEQVRVSDGPFASFNGYVEEADDDKARLKVAVSIFGRSTPVELEYSQVEKI